MLGSAMDAEDMVQETYVRYHAAAKEEILSLKAFLTTIISRLCVDQLHLARRKREQYLGPWLPEPIVTAEALHEVSPEERVDANESISLAFLTLLEHLQPLERAVFLPSPVAHQPLERRTVRRPGRPDAPAARRRARGDGRCQWSTGAGYACRRARVLRPDHRGGGRSDPDHSVHGKPAEAPPRLGRYKERPQGAATL